MWFYVILTCGINVIGIEFCHSLTSEVRFPSERMCRKHLAIHEFGIGVVMDKVLTKDTRARNEYFTSECYQIPKGV